MALRNDAVLDDGSMGLQAAPCRGARRGRLARLAVQARGARRGCPMVESMDGPVSSVHLEVDGAQFLRHLGRRHRGVSSPGAGNGGKSRKRSRARDTAPARRLPRRAATCRTRLHHGPDARPTRARLVSGRSRIARERRHGRRGRGAQRRIGFGSPSATTSPSWQTRQARLGEPRMWPPQGRNWKPKAWSSSPRHGTRAFATPAAFRDPDGNTLPSCTSATRRAPGAQLERCQPRPAGWPTSARSRCPSPRCPGRSAGGPPFASGASFLRLEEPLRPGWGDVVLA